MFLVGGNMACGVIGDDLMVRVGRDAVPARDALPHARGPCTMGGARWAASGVDGEGVAEDDALAAWVERGVDYARTLPPK